MTTAINELSLWLPYLVPLLFLGGWLLVSASLAKASGWPRLAQRFGSPGFTRPDGMNLRGQVVAVGSNREASVTHAVVSSAGLYLYASILFRFGRSPVLIPWSAVKYVQQHKYLLGDAHELKLGDEVTITVRDRGYQAIAPYLSPLVLNAA